MNFKETEGLPIHSHRAIERLGFPPDKIVV